jgi:hypothetical protein
VASEVAAVDAAVVEDEVLTIVMKMMTGINQSVFQRKQLYIMNDATANATTTTRQKQTYRPRFALFLYLTKQS